MLAGGRGALRGVADLIFHETPAVCPYRERRHTLADTVGLREFKRAAFHDVALEGV
jgi:hypothetical protein